MSRFNYQPLVKHMYKQSHSKTPMDMWVHAVGVNMPLIKTSELYDPVVLRVKTTGRIASPDGTVKHVINPEEPNWYHELCADLAKVAFGLSVGDAKHLSLRDMENQDIAKFSHAQLLVAGEIDVYDTRTGKQLLATERRQPSAQLHSNKLSKLYEWSEDLNHQMAAIIASKLAGSANIEELEMRTQPGGELHKALITAVKNSSALTSLYGVNHVARSVPDQVVAERIATAALDQMCAGIDANGTKIIGHFANKVATSAVGNSERKPLLQQYRSAAAIGANATAAGQQFATDAQLYSHIASKALTQGPYTRKLVYMVYKPIECHHTTHGHAGKKGKKHAEKKLADYVKSDAQHFQLYSGRPIYMSPIKQQAVAEKQMPATNYQVREHIGKALPALEPVGTKMGSFKDLPPLEPVGTNMRSFKDLPPLEPVGAPLRSSKPTRAMPALVESRVVSSNRPMSLMDILNAKK